MTIDWLWIGQVGAASLMNVSFAFAVGLALFGAWLEADGRRPVAPAHAAWLRAQRSLRSSAFVLVLSLAAWLVYESAMITASTLAGALDAVPAVLTQTHVGIAWSVAFGGALLLLVSSLVNGGAVRVVLLWLAVLIVAAGRAGLGHAADAGFVSVAYGVHILHLLSASAWSGIGIAGGLAVLPALGTSAARSVLIRTTAKVSAAAFVAVGVVLATGVFNGIRGTGGSFEPLTRSTWGHVLLVKLALIAVALALGGFNRMVAMRRLKRTASTADARRFAHVLYLEAIVMIGVLVAAAVLAHSVPGSAMHG